MSWQSFKDRFRGREAWRSINIALFFGIYTLVFIGVLYFPIKIMIWIFIGLGIALPSYSTLFVNHLREMEKREKGNKLIMGWITHAYGSAEPIYFTPIKFERVDKLSPENLQAMQDYVKECSEYAKETKVKTGFDVFKPKGISYKKVAEKEALNKVEIKNLIKEEMEEIIGFKNDFKKMIRNREDNNKKESEEVINLIKNMKETIKNNDNNEKKDEQKVDINE